MESPVNPSENGGHAPFNGHLPIHPRLAEYMQGDGSSFPLPTQSQYMDPSLFPTAAFQYQPDGMASGIQPDNEPFTAFSFDALMDPMMSTVFLDQLPPTESLVIEEFGHIIPLPNLTDTGNAYTPLKGTTSSQSINDEWSRFMGEV